MEGKEKTTEIIKDGKAVSLEGLEEWDVLTVFESRDKEVLKILASSEKLSGTAESFSAESGTIVIDRELYLLKDTLAMTFVTLGGSYEFCLDSDGSIAAMKAESAASSMVGFLIKAKREQGITNVLQLKLFTSGGVHVAYRCSDSLQLGGLKGAAAAEYLENNADGGLVSYKLDSQGEVKEVDLPYVGMPAPHQRPEGLRLEHKANKELLYRNAQNAFEEIINMDGETVVFLIPDDLEDENGYDITSASYFMNNTRYAPDAYCMGTEDGRADFLVYTPKDKYTDQEGAVLVSKITRMVNQKGETTECLHGYKDSGEVTVLAKEDGMFTQAGVKEGDVVRYLTGKQGYATGVRKILDYDSGRIVNDANLSYSNGFRVLKGAVYHKYR